MTPTRSPHEQSHAIVDGRRVPVRVVHVDSNLDLNAQAPEEIQINTDDEDSGNLIVLGQLTVRVGPNGCFTTLCRSHKFQHWYEKTRFEIGMVR
jgi:hypothetical protein